MKKIILTGMIFLIGCASNVVEANAPFVDVDETLKLEHGMSPYQVKEIMGSPLFIKSGKENEVEWAYEVRYRVIESKKRGPDYFSSKKGPFVDYSSPQSTLVLVFKDKYLDSWYTDFNHISSYNKKISKVESIFPLEVLYGAVLPTILLVAIMGG